MLPSSFAPMIFKLIMHKVADHFMKTFKLDKVLRYVEEPNEADLLGKDNKDQIEMLAGELAMMENRLKKLEILSGETKKIKKNAK